MIFQQHSDQVNELYTALAMAQADMLPAIKSANMASNYGQNKRYANYDDMVEATRPALTKHKISVYHDIIEVENGERYLYTCTTHASGQFKAGWIRLDRGENKQRNAQQELGSCLTYYKRYAYAAAIGLSFDDGDDYDSPKYQRDNKQEQVEQSDDKATEKQWGMIKTLDKAQVAQACVDLNLDYMNLTKNGARQLISHIKGE